MKKILLITIFLASGICYAQTGRDNSIIRDCRVSLEYGFETLSFTLSGNVFAVANPKEHADLRIKAVKQPGEASLYVYRTLTGDFDCGVWRFVNERKRAKFTIRFVTSNEDIAVYWVATPEQAGSRY